MTSLNLSIKKKLIKILEDTVPSKLSSTRLNEAWITRNIKRVFKTRKGALSKNGTQKIRRTTKDTYVRLLN